MIGQAGNGTGQVCYRAGVFADPGEASPEEALGGVILVPDSSLNCRGGVFNRAGWPRPTGVAASRRVVVVILIIPANRAGPDIQVEPPEQRQIRKTDEQETAAI